MSTVLLSSTFFGPIQWYQKLNRYERVLIENCDSYQKQTYRNRCLIATTNGVQPLTVPVSIEGGKVRVSSHGNWRHHHWQALTSAYGDSPFFQYYEDDLRPFFTDEWEFLYDFNEATRCKICELIDIQPNATLTSYYIKDVADCFASAKDVTRDENVGGVVKDFREIINPKHPMDDSDFVPQRYYQVYERKFGFISNLSILDLLFNMGPESIFLL